MNIKSSVNKDSDKQALQVQTGEGAFPLEGKSLQKPFKKKKYHKVLTPEQKTRRVTFKKALAWLCETFPDCFNLSTPKPLKKQIVVDIFSHLSEDQSISKRTIRTVLAFYVNRKKYHESLLENLHRFNLDGSTAEEIVLAHQEHAKAVLKRKAQRKAVRQADKEKIQGIKA